MLRKIARAGVVGLAALPAVALLLVGCAGAAPDPRLVGNRAQLCADRVPLAQAELVIGESAAALRELSTFQPGRRVGECALHAPDGGAKLSVQVVHDPKGTALARELERLSQTDEYSGDDRSGVTGEAPTTTALYAVDAHYYVRVLGLGGTSEAQRHAALELARDLAARTTSLR